MGTVSTDAFWYVAALASGLSEIGVAVVSAVCAAIAVGALVWMRRQTKKAFMGWFSEAVDTHVEPKFAQLKAMQTEELRVHTGEEGNVVRTVVAEEVAPLRAILDSRNDMFDHLEASLTATQEKLDEHMGRDEAFAEQVGKDLKKGQDALLRALTRNQDKQLGT